MGDVKVKEVRDVEPIRIDRLHDIDPLRIEKIAPAAIHVKELNHIDPISVESLRIDEVRNLDPVQVERFDVTHLPTVNLSVGQVPSLDLSLRRVPPLAVGVHQDFVMPSEYLIRGRLLGLEVLRLHVTGRTVLRPRDPVRREAVQTHERSYPEVAAVGNPGLPDDAVAERAEVQRHVPRRPQRPARRRVRRSRLHHRPPPPRAPAGEGMTVGRPAFSFSIGDPSPSYGESGVSAG
jgi:hypothetical protein